MANAPKMRAIGYISWNPKEGPWGSDFPDREISEHDITDGDRKAGYVSRQVYVDDSQEPR